MSRGAGIPSLELLESIILLSGVRGEMGPQGPQGPQGLQGLDGALGAPGDNGSPGIKGDAGIDGARGLQGIPGSAGADGSPGVPGTKGDKGDTGSAGANGTQGPQGIQGPAGAKGDTGLQGPKGDTGSAGTPGAKGDTGSTGSKGDAGSQGTQGIQGVKGDTGAAGATIGYAINVQALTSSPADSQTVYFGTLPRAPVTGAGTSKVYIRKTGTIKIAEIYVYSGTAGTAENWSLYIRLNNSSDTLIQTKGVNTNERVFSNTSLNITVAAGDYIEIKGVQPLWATNPATTIYGGYIYIE